MICVSIGQSRYKMAKMEHHALAENGADLVEFRLDWLQRLPKLDRLIRDRPTPVVITCRRKSDQGRWEHSEEARRTVLRAAVVAGVEYVDLEEDAAKDIRRYGNTKRIVSYHNFEETPADLAEIHARLAALDPDIVKIVTMANSPSDSIRMLQLTAEARVPTVGFCMGDYGIFSRILCRKYGAPFTYAASKKSRQLAPGQLTFEELKDVYHCNDLNSETEVYGVLGDPVGHSRSPHIHNAAFRELGLNCVYVPFRVPAEGLQEALSSFEWLQVRGYSVTIPHKEAALAKAEESEPAVADIGALNTLWRDEAGRWHGANTDYDAALATLQSGLPEGETLAGKSVLMLGAGGVASAVGLGIVRSEAHLTIANRNGDRAENLAAQLKCKHVPWDERTAIVADVLINCTSVGMHPAIDETPIDASILRDGMLVFDTVYNPEETLLLRQAKEQGCRTASGLDMFVRQAAAQFQHFTGRPAPLERMTESIRQKPSRPKPIEPTETSTGESSDDTGDE